MKCIRDYLMNHCHMRSTCTFFNKQAADKPHLTGFLRELYCVGNNSTHCIINRIAILHGREKVPKYLYPNDMLIMVVYCNGSTGTERTIDASELIHQGKIVAYQCSQGWVKVDH
jgi:hypothetical protein